MYGHAYMAVEQKGYFLRPGLAGRGGGGVIFLINFMKYN
jgi:hypothetical protein